MCSVLRISKPTKDISSTNMQDLIFDSEKTYFSIKTRDNIQASISATDWDSPPPAPTVVTYNHNFGYKPRFMVFVKSYLSENYSKWAFADFVNLDFNVIHEAPGFNIEEYLNCYVTDTQLVISANLYENVSGSSRGVAHTYTFDFVLFMEEAV